MLYEHHRLVRFKVSVRKLFFALALLCVTFPCWGQLTIRGIVTDRGGLPGVSILLLDLDSTSMAGTVTDSAGTFTLENVPPGEYLLSARMVGYMRYYSQPITIRDEHLLLGAIELKEEVVQLTEIVVKAERDLFEQATDRVVINVQNSVSSAGNTVLEVLQKSPGVVVDRQANTIRVQGRSGVTVMINNKPISLSSDGMLQLLDGMAAANIDKIELVSHPGARYDAQGGGGVIRIVTKVEPDVGTTASVSLMAGLSWAETLGGNISLQHKSSRVTWFTDYGLSRRHNLHIFRTDELRNAAAFNQQMHAYSHRDNITVQQNLRAGAEWMLDKHTTIDIGVTAYKRAWNLTADTDENAYATVDSTIATQMQIVELNNWHSITGAVGLTRKINKSDDLSVGVDYLYYGNSNPSNYRLKSLHEQTGREETSAIDLSKNTPIHFLVGHADYRSTPHKQFSWEAGVKSVYSMLDNDVTVMQKENERWAFDSTLSSSSSLIEYIYAAYASTTWHPHEGTDINAGLRYEFTKTFVSGAVDEEVVDREYGYWFPSLSVQKTLGDGKTMKLSYTRRIVRPGYNDIAPFVFFWASNTFSSGNTKLFPAVTDGITTSYQKNQWTVSLNFTHTRNEIAFLQPELNEQSKLIYRSQNMESLNTLAITNAYAMAPSGWLDMQANLTVQYQIGKSSHLPVNVERNLWGVNLSLVNRIKLPKEFSIEVSALYQSKTMSGASMYQPLGSLNAGVQKNFGKHGVLQLSMDDILYTNYWKIWTRSPESNLASYFEYDWHNQFIRLTYTRRFGNLKTKVVEKKSAEEERGRVR